MRSLVFYGILKRRAFFKLFEHLQTQEIKFKLKILIFSLKHQIFRMFMVLDS